jgi:DNA-binding transcriptional LysR family regulator
MELRHLRYFTALAEELHFGRAAVRVHITQPPFSKQIKELEDEIQVRLFSRDNRNVELTPAGNVFLSYVTQLFQLIDIGINDTRRADRGQLGKLTIGYTGTAFTKVLPAVLRHFRTHHSDVELVLHEMVPPEQIEALEQNKIDVGFMRPEPAIRQFNSEVLLRERLVLAVPADHALARGASIDIRRLKNEDFIMLPRREGGLYQQIIELCQRAGFQPKVTQVATQLRSIVGLVSAGIGISIVPSSARRNLTNVTYKDLRGMTCYTDLAVVSRKEGETPVLAAFLGAARQASKRL